MKRVIFVFQAFIAIILLQMAASGKIAKRSSGPSFPNELFHQVTKVKPNQNIIISPVSIQTCVAMGYFGADGKTAEEMSTGLHLTSNNKEQVAHQFEKLSNPAPGLIKIANKLYANKLYEIKPEFNQVAEKAFHSKAETLDFGKSAESIKTINDWVEHNTNNKIKNLLAAGSVDGDTKMILVNAIHFKGEWVNPFSTHSTHKGDFWNTQSNKVSANMMYNSDPYKYAEYADLDATAIEMAYNNSELSMMMILPNKRDGLGELLSKLKNKDFIELSQKMHKHDIDVTIPKFKVEFDIILNDVLKSMGMTTMFSDAANFSHLFKSKIPVKVSEVVHKAFIDVNEAGSEAAATTIMKIVPMSLNLDQKSFKADHPFVYLIKDKTSVYFVGQIAKF